MYDTHLLEVCSTFCIYFNVVNPIMITTSNCITTVTGIDVCWNSIELYFLLFFLIEIIASTALAEGLNCSKIFIMKL